MAKLVIVVLMAILAVCAAHPQGLFDFFSQLFSIPLSFLGLTTSPKPSNSSSTGASSNTSATASTG
uniref:Uncharacterized protein n=1 Tax=Coptotermes formosanus TaxID=36987 RepID=R4UV33_COPFO|nr:hypothetical protein [Coptotermes formosanus]